MAKIEGLTWKATFGEDFTALYLRNDRLDVKAGMCIGINLDMQDRSGDEKEKGLIAGQKAVWVRRRPNPKDQIITYEAMIEYRHKWNYAPVQIHIWLNTLSDIEKDEFLKWASDLRFEQVSTQDIDPDKPWPSRI
ncbi:hypothetical protein ACFL4W_03140 [Planctomycetota bacterium]